MKPPAIPTSCEVFKSRKCQFKLRSINNSTCQFSHTQLHLLHFHSKSWHLAKIVKIKAFPVGDALVVENKQPRPTFYVCFSYTISSCNHTNTVQTRLDQVPTNAKILLHLL